jgi:hypothetical protein
MAKAKKKDKKSKKDKADSVVMTLLARLPSLDETHRDAFTSQFDDAECAKLGAETRSSAVRDCAMSWAADAIGALLDPSLAPRIHYSPARLAWVLELVARLESERAKSKSAEQKAVRTTRDVSTTRARQLRLELLEKLEAALAGREEDLRHLTDARAKENAGESLAALSALIGDLLSRTGRDGALKVLLDSAHVTAQDASAASAAAESISSARADVILGGRMSDKDSPATNVVEGRITKELRVIYDAFSGARERGVPAPALVPSAPIRRALSRPATKKAKTPTEPTPPS